MSTELLHPTDLEPARLDASTYVTRRRLGRVDAASTLCLMIALLTLIPAQLIIPGTTDVGRPAIVVGMVMAAWWVGVRLSPGLTLVGAQPVRWGVFFLLFSDIVSYATGHLRGLTAMEANSADRWMLGTVAMVGVILIAADGLANWERLRVVLVWFVGCCSVMAFIGLLQSMLEINVVQYLTVPGLALKGEIPGFQQRGGGLRVAATTAHYIELSAILATSLPFALHLVRFARSRRGRQWALVAALLIGLGIPATISRTGIIAAAIAVGALMPLWSWRVRYNITVLGVGLLMALAVVKSSLASTLVDMFVNLSSDDSITSRTEDYDLVGYYFAQTPWLGRGTGTWVFPQYIYLDNQWLSTALCNGVLGVVALATLHIVAISVAVLALRRASAPEDKHLCVALISTQIIGIFVGATFDSLWFSSYAMVLSLTIGLCGTVWRFTHPARIVRTAAPHG